MARCGPVPTQWLLRLLALAACLLVTTGSGCECESVWEPVCTGREGLTYPNYCTAVCSGATPSGWSSGVCEHQRGSLARELSASPSVGNSTTAHAGGHGMHPHVALCWLCVSLVFGTATLHFTSRYMTWLPYTCVCMLEGFVMGAVHKMTGKGLGTLSVSIDMWLTIDPHLLLYAFLPALLFGDTMGLNIHVSRKSLRSCLLLAGPGVLFGTGMTAVVAKYVLPYGWDWKTA